MPLSKKKEYKIIPNPELLRVGRTFVPVFGSDEDLAIVNRVASYEKLIRTVDNEIMRAGDPKKLTTVMKRVLQQEQSLIHAITSRNMDF